MSSQRENRNRPKGGSIDLQGKEFIDTAIFFLLPGKQQLTIYTGTLEEFLLRVEEKSIDYIYLRTEPN